MRSTFSPLLWPLFVFLVLAACGPVRAQSFVEDGFVIPAGSVQLEAQALRTTGDTETGAELLVQWSPLPRLELRLGTPSYIDTDFGAGFSDPSVGVKAELGAVGAWAFGVLASLTLPLGGDLFGSGTADPELLVGAARPLGEAMLGGHLAVGRDRSADRWLFGGVLGLGVPLGERWTAYVEADGARVEGGDLALLAHQGLTYALHQHVQIDAHVGIGLTGEAPDTLLGLGLTVQM